MVVVAVTLAALGSSAALVLVPQSASASARGTRHSSALGTVVSSGNTPLQTCFWRGPLDGKGRTNAAFPDLNATYWTAVFPFPQAPTEHRRLLSSCPLHVVQLL